MKRDDLIRKRFGGLARLWAAEGGKAYDQPSNDLGHRSAFRRKMVPRPPQFKTENQTQDHVHPSGSCQP